MTVSSADVQDASLLGKSLEQRHVSMISIGGVIGAGLFVGSSSAIASAGPAIVVSYVLGGIVLLFVMRTIAEMAVAVPEVSSFTEFARLGLGEWAGFLNGWLYWYSWVITLDVEAIAGATILHDWINVPVWIIGCVLLAATTGVNLMSTRSYGEFEFWFSSIKVAAILAFIGIGAASVLGHPSHAMFVNLVGSGGFAPLGGFAVLSGVTTAVFALSGAEITTIAAAESPEPAKTIARLTSTIVVRVMLFYVCSIFLIVVIVPWRDVVPGVSPFATALTQLHVPWAAAAMQFVVLTAVLSCLNSGLYVTSRVLFSLALKGDAPQRVMTVTKHRVPAAAILTGSAVAFVGVLASAISPSVVFAFLVNASGAVVLVSYLLTVVAEIRVRRRLEREAPDRLVVKMWLFPYASIAIAIFIVAILLSMTLDTDLASQLYATLGVMAVVLAVFFVRDKWR